ncbi:MAG: molecular chaperone HtpG [Lewinellaceae bacterium]|nr:molecular chaperone HtpG [Saprospiraceae bacterium]MCB9337180.1 molecular chaperone HtpG [Lewinellaceae bacterium]
MQKGNISVQTENIFPIIKKFLYSDHEIFLRELISNAVDATTKLKSLASRGDFKGELGDLTIEVIVDEKKKTLTIRDKGIGMTEEEVGKYLNQIAISSAQEFLEKYQSEHNIIGKFGLGFYSAFMVADKVEAITKSWKEGEPGVTWVCEGNPEYQVKTNKKTQRGTDIVLHINDENKEFLENHRIEQLLTKYCKFLPVPIKFGTKKETIEEGEGEKKKEKEITADNIINNTAPAWKKQPNDLNDQDYKDFYQELYPFTFESPLFWIHLNIDYPFNLTGILYFPKLHNALEVQKNKIHLYSNQVYVTDEVKEIVPEFLTLLHGVIDSPDIPLNVSRSYLQSDSNVKKITGYITKKVADKLHDLFKNDRKGYEEKWQDLGVFVKYGMLSDEKFHERAVDFVLLKNSDGECYTIEDYKKKIEPNQTDKHKRLIMLYTHSPVEHHSLVEAAKGRGYDVLVMDNVIDTHFAQHLEYKLQNVTFVRVDSDTVDNLVQKDEKTESVLSEKEQETVKAVFESVAKKAAGATVQLKPMSPDDQPVQITKPEFIRRMKEMQAFSGGGMGTFDDMYNVVVNTNHPYIAEKLLKLPEGDERNHFSKHLLDLALLNQGMLKGADLTAFVKKSLEFLK